MDEHRMPRGAISRRRFLGGGAVLLGGGLLSGSTLAQQLCALTQGDILGPYYRFGAPFQSRLVGPEEPGERLMITGTLFSSDCRTPVPGALMEIWQANSAGLYDTQKPGNFTDKGDFHLRGMLYTDAQGRYRIETVMPGRYPVPPNLPGLEKYGGLMRPAHIHFRVIDSLHVPVTLQLYFKGDPHIAGDPWARDRSTNTIELQRDGELRRGVFDIVLARGFQ